MRQDAQTAVRPIYRIPSVYELICYFAPSATFSEYFIDVIRFEFIGCAAEFHLCHRILERTLQFATFSVQIFKGRQNYVSHSTSFAIRMNGELCVITVTIESPFNHGIGRYRSVAVSCISCSIVNLFFYASFQCDVVVRRTA